MYGGMTRMSLAQLDTCGWEEPSVAASSPCVRPHFFSAFEIGFVVFAIFFRLLLFVHIFDLFICRWSPFRPVEHLTYNMCGRVFKKQIVNPSQFDLLAWPLRAYLQSSGGTLPADSLPLHKSFGECVLTVTF